MTANRHAYEAWMAFCAERQHRCEHGARFDEGCWACSDEMGLLAWMGDPDA